MGGARPGTGKTRPGSARPGTSVPASVLAKTQKLNSSRPRSVPHDSPYRPVSRAEKMGGGSMGVKEQKLFDDLVLGGIAKRKNNKLAPLNVNAPSEGGSAFMTEAEMRQKFMDERRQKLEERRAEETEALKRALRWRLADAHAERDKREAARLKTIQDGQEGLVTEINDFLKNKAEQTHMKTAEVHHVWENEVYNRIESQIAKKTGEKNREEINRRLNDQMDKYVEACSAKTLFRDIIIESEYNPFESQAAVIKVDARPRSKTVWDGIKDPLNEQIEKVMEIHQDKTAVDMPTLAPMAGKATLPLREWATGVIEDTPHGFANKAFEKSIAEMGMSFEQKQERAKRNVSTLTMEHYSYARGKEVLFAEYPKGKKCFPGWKAGQSEAQREKEKLEVKADPAPFALDDIEAK